MEKELKQKKSRFNLPDTYVLMMIFILIAAVLTYIVPAGEYNMIKNEVTGTSVADPSSFHSVEQNPTSILSLLLAVPKGLNKQAAIINMIFLITGFIQIVEDTGAIDRVIGMTINKLKGRELLVIPVVALLMSTLGMLGAMSNAVVAFIPLGCLVAKKIGVDPVVAVAITFLACFNGFGTTPVYPTTLQLAQMIAEVPVLSGFNFRIIMWVIVTAITIWYTMRYAKRVQADPKNSVMDKIVFPENIDDSKMNVPFSIKDIIIVFVLFGGFAIYVFGTMKYKWGTEYLSGVLLGIAVVAGLIGRMSLDEMAKAFVKGCKSVCYPAILTGFATGITVVLTDGNVIHTIVRTLSIPLNYAGPVISSWLMLVLNMFFNLLVPSGSGQAALVMPLLAPLCDVIGMERQVAVVAYQYGDLMTNMIIPTSGTVMASIAIAGVKYEKWLKFVMPLFLILTAVILVSLIFVLNVGI